jgi:hypothetical protein
VLKRDLALRGRQKVVEFLVKAKDGARHEVY